MPAGPASGGECCVVKLNHCTSVDEITSGMLFSFFDEFLTSRVSSFLIRCNLKGTFRNNLKGCITIKIEPNELNVLV